MTDRLCRPCGPALEEETRELRSLLGKTLDVLELDHAMARDDWTRACLLAGRYCHPFITVDPRCSRCGDPASSHEVDDEERRECRLCECAQYEAP